MKEFDRDEYISECYATPAHNVRRPHKHAELIKAWADGAEIEYEYDGEWIICFSNPAWQTNVEYRIKPEPKSDEVRYMYQPAGTTPRYDWFEVSEESFAMTTKPKETIKVIRDGETGELKSAEVLK